MYRRQRVENYLRGNPYPGRGIIMGKSPTGKKGIIGYFIMGRSENSRNRIFTAVGEGLKTEAFDPDKVSDPSLIIYHPVRVWGKMTMVTNGDQTDTIYQHLLRGEGFAAALRTRTYEPDAPNYTPRISGLATLGGGDFSYVLSLIKKCPGEGRAAQRFFYEYEAPLAGEGHILHTYGGDGHPLPPFEGEPVNIDTEEDITSFAAKLWASLNDENKVALFVRYIHLSTGRAGTRIYNKLQGGEGYSPGDL